MHSLQVAINKVPLSAFSLTFAQMPFCSKLPTKVYITKYMNFPLHIIYATYIFSFKKYKFDKHREFEDKQQTIVPYLT